MGLSKEMLNAIEKAENVAHSAVSYVGQANYAEREADAKRRVREAFQTVYELISTEDGRRLEERWREAVANGLTTDGLTDWSEGKL